MTLSIKNIKRIITARNHLHSKRTKTFEKYGGSVNMHPDVVSYFMIHHDWKFDFFTMKKMVISKAHIFCAMENKLG